MNTQKLTTTYLLQPYRFSLIGVLLFTLIKAASTAGYAYLSGPLISTFLGNDRSNHSANELKWIIIYLVGFALLKGLSQLLEQLSIARIIAGIGRTLRVLVFKKLIEAPLAIHRSYQHGDLICRLTDDVYKVQHAFVEAPLTWVKEIIAAIVLVMVALYLAPLLTLISLVLLPILALSIRMIGRRVRDKSRFQQQALSALIARASQTLQAIAEVKSAGAQEQESQKIDSYAEENAAYYIRRVFIRALSPLFNEVAASLGIGLMLLWAFYYQRGHDTSSIISFSTALLMLYRPIKAISHASTLIQEGRASLDRLTTIIDVESESLDRIELPLDWESIAFKRFNFSYENTDEQPLWQSPIELSFKRGDIVCIMGESGSGKTTLMHLVSGLDRPLSGEIEIDSERISIENALALRQLVALVPQQPMLLTASLRENLLLGHDDLSDSEGLWQTLDAVGLKERVEALPQKLETMLGQGAQGLSVGETQRLAIARALLEKRSIIVMDEPSAALDEENEQILLESISELAEKNRLSFCIATHSDSFERIATKSYCFRSETLERESSS